MAANSILCCLQTASTQGIDAQASRGSVAPLTERSDEAFSSGSFLLLTGNEAPQDARYSRWESMNVRPFVPKGIFQFEERDFQFWVLSTTTIFSTPAGEGGDSSVITPL